MSKNFPVNPLEAVAERKLCNEKISTVSLYWCDSRRNFSYAAIARAQIAFIAVQPLNDLGLALCIFDDLGRCAFASPHAPFESESSAGVIAAGPQQVSLWFRTCLPPGRYTLSFSLAERSDPSDDPAGWKVLCQQTHYLPFTILEGGSPPPPLGYAQIQTYSVLESQIAVESLPENEALDHFPWALGPRTLSEILSDLDISLVDKHSRPVLLHLAPSNIKGLPLLRLSGRGESNFSETGYRQLAPILSKNSIVVVEDTNGISSSVFYHAGEQRPVYLILFMPENHFSWTEVLLALANELWEKEGGISIFVTPDLGKLPNFDGSPAVHSTITLDDLIAAHEGLEFSRMYVHGFGHPKFSDRLRQAFPKTLCGFYGDGFKNALPNLPQADEIVFFGWSPAPSHCPQRLVSDQAFHRALAQLSKDFELPKTVLAADVMLCLRYYGSGPYQVGADQVCELIWETIRAVLRPGDALVIKADARAPNLTQTVITFLAQRHEGEVRDFATDVGDWADKPLELLFASDCLTQIRDFVVFDSSLCWLLLHAPKLRHDLRVLFGANLESLNGTVSSDNKINQMIETIRHYTKEYAIALERDGCVVNRLVDACYVASRPEMAQTALIANIDQPANHC